MTTPKSATRRLLTIAALAVAATLPALAVRSQDDASLSVIVDKGSTYVVGYVKALSSIVAEEHYEQRLTRLVTRGAAPLEKQVTSRILLSDYLLVQVPGLNEWMPFRDVYSVDAVPVRDRNDRLLKLFVEPSATAAARIFEIRKESSRYNIRNVGSDINSPMFALQVLDPRVRAGFAFKYRGSERFGGPDMAVIEYSETARPTMIRGGDYEDVPATGRLWVQPDTGAVLRWLLETRPKGMKTRIEVTYRWESSLAMLVPNEMIERRDMLDEVVEGRATYSKIRRFRVDTTVEIK